jgi:acetyl esterase
MRSVHRVTNPIPAGLPPAAAELDPDLLRWLLGLPVVALDAPVDERRALTRSNQALALARLELAPGPASESSSVIDGPAGPIPVRVFTPSGEGQKPVLVYFHGGGWVIGDLDSHVGHARRLCVEVDAVVVSVGYRLAPEDRYSAAFDDALAATAWAAAAAPDLGGDPARLAVGGDSAGGQLAASVALARRDAGQPLAAQLLLYPVCDVTGNYHDAEVNARYPSRAKYADGPGLTLAGMADFADLYVSRADASDWRVSPLRAPDLGGVAPAIVHTAAVDVLSSEGNQYAEALRLAGVAVTARENAGLNHGYFPMGGVSRVAGAAAAQAAVDLRAVLGGRVVG